jgi:hypothetical protein
MAPPQTVKSDKAGQTAENRASVVKMLSATIGIIGIAWAVLTKVYANDSLAYHSMHPSRSNPPPQAQLIDQKAFNVLPNVPPATVANATTVSRHPYLPKV